MRLHEENKLHEDSEGFFFLFFEYVRFSSDLSVLKAKIKDIPTKITLTDLNV